MADKKLKPSLISRHENLILKPLKKLDYKAFVDFSKEYDGKVVSVDEFSEIQASKEFLFLQTGKLWLYLFEKRTQNRFDAGELIGYVEITPNAESENVAEVGYFVNESKRGCGYGKIMLKMALQTCAYMEFEMLTASVEVSNAPSVAVLKSAGFEFQDEKQDGSKASAFLKMRELSESSLK